jgi:hypothetical protein
MMIWTEMPRSPGHVFYDRLQKILAATPTPDMGKADDLREEA